MNLWLMGVTVGWHREDRVKALYYDTIKAIFPHHLTL